MMLLDVNVLVYAHRADSRGHGPFRGWLEDLLNGVTTFAVANETLSGFLRVVTHPRIFEPPTPLEDALRFAETIRGSENYVLIEPGPRHWELFTDLCRKAEARGNLVADAYLAALALESGSEWITTDRDFSRFPGLRWRHPLAS